MLDCTIDETILREVMTWREVVGGEGALGIRMDPLMPNLYEMAVVLGLSPSLRYLHLFLHATLLCQSE